jgi:hypothetical protein
MTTVTTVAALLAYDPDKVKPGWIAFFIVMTLVVATFLLWRSMNTQLGKIKVPPRSSFGPDGAERTGAPASEGGRLIPPRSSSPAPSPPRLDDDDR